MARIDAITLGDIRPHVLRILMEEGEPLVISMARYSRRVSITGHNCQIEMPRPIFERLIRDGSRFLLDRRRLGVGRSEQPSEED